MRGLEILQFIDGFIKCSGIPAIEHSEDGRAGGIVLAGWSLGSAFTLAAVANVDSQLVSEEMRGRLGQYLRAHIMLGTTRLSMDNVH